MLATHVCRSLPGVCASGSSQIAVVAAPQSVHACLAGPAPQPAAPRCPLSLPCCQSWAIACWCWASTAGTARRLLRHSCDRGCRQLMETTVRCTHHSCRQVALIRVVGRGVCAWRGRGFDRLQRYPAWAHYPPDRLLLLLLLCMRVAPQGRPAGLVSSRGPALTSIPPPHTINLAAPATQVLPRDHRVLQHVHHGGVGGAGG
jgi:hypothetical protein